MFNMRYYTSSCEAYELNTKTLTILVEAANTITMMRGTNDAPAPKLS